MAKKADVRVGQVYRAKVNGRVVPCRVDAIREQFNGRGKDTTVYDVTNLATGRKTTFRSAMKFRELVQATVVDATAKVPVVPGQFVGPNEVKLHEPVDVPGKDGAQGFKEDEQRSDPTAPTASTPAPTPTTLPDSTTADTAVDPSPGGNGRPTSPAGSLSFALHRAASREPAPVGEIVAGMVPTDEQRAGLEKAAEVFRAKDGPRVLVQTAGAGCGKTAQLRMTEAVLPGQGQYTARNAAIVADSARKFVRVSCKTTHALAFREVGRLYKHRLNGPRVRAAQVARQLGIGAFSVKVADEATGERTKDKVLQPDHLAALVMMAIKKFSQSADAEILPAHFKYVDGIDEKTEDGRRGWDNNRRVTEHLLPFARKAWVDLASPEGVLPFNHDHYVKVWQLGTPHIAADYILLDEAQDTAPVMLDVLRRQTHAMLIMVGDSNQSIYEWAGAVDAMKAFPGAPRTQLSQSFRFGQAVADVANAILSTLDEPTDLVMRGLPSIPSRVGPVAEPRCRLFRTNAGAVGEVLQGIAVGKRGHLVGGGEEVVKFVKAAIDLRRGRGTSHPDLACFASWAEVEAYAKTDEGEDLALLVRLIKTFGAEEILRALENMPSERDADFVCCTAHKSKGREWATVKLGADFPVADKMNDADRRLLYVAATRAQEELDLTECPPFSQRVAREEDEDGEWRERDVPTIEVRFTAPMPTPEQLAEWRSAKMSRMIAPIVADGKVEVAQLEAKIAEKDNGNPSPAEAPKEFTWAKLDGAWLVRGPKVEPGARVKVVRKNGTSSIETLKSISKQIGELWFYKV